MLFRWKTGKVKDRFHVMVRFRWGKVNGISDFNNRCN